MLRLCQCWGKMLGSLDVSHPYYFVCEFWNVLSNYLYGNSLVGKAIEVYYQNLLIGVLGTCIIKTGLRFLCIYYFM